MDAHNLLFALPIMMLGNSPRTSTSHAPTAISPSSFFLPTVSLFIASTGDSISTYFVNFTSSRT